MTIERSIPMYDLVDQRVDRLCHGSRFMLWAMRNWVQAVGDGQCPPRVLAPSFAGMGAIGALSGVHLAVAFLNGDALETLALHPNACRRIGEHEAILLTLWADSLDPAHRARRQATLDLLVHDRAETIGQALEDAAAILAAAHLAPRGLAPVPTREVRP
jgi:hypothetical protein